MLTRKLIEQLHEDGEFIGLDLGFVSCPECSDKENERYKCKTCGVTGGTFANRGYGTISVYAVLEFLINEGKK